MSTKMLAQIERLHAGLSTNGGSLVPIIAPLVRMSRKRWKEIIDSESDEDYIGVMQTVARCLYEGRMSDLTSLVDWLDKHGSCG